MATPAGPPTRQTRCLICRSRQKPGWVWFYAGPMDAEGEDPFAGYFDTVECKQEYLALSEEEKIRVIFGRADIALMLAEQVDSGRWKCDTEADPQGVPIFEHRPISEARDPKTGRLARYRMTGYRAVQS